MSDLQVSLLGPMRVVLNGQTLSWLYSDKVRALLAYLVVEADRPHRRESLAGLLWPDYPEASARRSLSQALFALRGILDPDGTTGLADTLITAARAELRLNSRYVVSDVGRFEALLAACAAHGHPDGQPCAACAERLSEVLSLCRGELLAGFSLTDSPEFGEWLAMARERTRRAALNAAASLAQSAEGSRGDQLSLDAARRWVELDPLDEEGQRCLMGLLATHGQRRAALAQFEACRRLLREQLNVEPEPATRALYARIRADDPVLREAPAAPPERGVSPVATLGASPSLPAPAADDMPGQIARHNLPAAVDSFVGREREVRELRALLADPSVRLVTLTGAGGMGKTRLALETARSALAGSLEEAWFVDLAPLPAAAGAPTAAQEGVLRALAAALGVQAAPGSDLLEGISVALRERRAWVMLDNCEHVLEAAGLVALELASRCPTLTLLATSREPLRVSGEHVYVVTPLALPELAAGMEAGGGAAPAALNALLQSESVRLLAERARAARYGATIDETNVGAATEICRRLDGIPLAIELAAARLNALSLQEVVDRLDGHLLADGRLHPRWNLLSAGSRAAQPRQQTMLNTVAWSYGLLAEEERLLFDRLSVFAGSFALAAAESVCGSSPLAALDVDLLLAELVDCSLVQRVEQGGTTRYRLLETLRAFGQERLAERGESALLAWRHAEFYAGLIDAAAPVMRRGEPRYYETLSAVTLEMPNIQAAVRWSLSEGDGLAALRIAGSAPFWGVTYVPITEPRTWALAALERVERATGRPAEARLRAWALNTVANHDFVWYDGEEMARTIVAQLAAAHEVEDACLLAWAHSHQFQLARQESRFADEELHLRQALALAQESGEVGLATCLQVNLTPHAPREQRAATLERVLAAAPEGYQAYSNQIAGVVAWSAGDTVRAERWFRVSVELWTQVGNLRSAGSMRRALSGVLGQLGRLDEALEQALRGAEECRRGGDENGRMLGLVQHCILSWLALRPDTVTLLHALLREPYGYGPGRYGVINRLQLARVAYGLREPTLGARLLEDAGRDGGLDNYPFGDFATHEALGWDALLNKDHTAAAHHFRQGLDGVGSTDRDDAATTMEHLAWALAAARDLDGAAAALAEAASEREAMGMVLYPVEVPHHERAVALVARREP